MPTATDMSKLSIQKVKPDYLDAVGADVRASSDRLALLWSDLQQGAAVDNDMRPGFDK